ncbi:hypothetical protein CDAR_544441 [Caerostris darwini]|uniref:Uncharacterized protein n=1 Tax=Caerostris darwini TaxID=1538125 RepID=A0AAV4TDW0_9ARAC|nr:hypothetical protein CDAR_544441 [Caerostris darwini]
MRTLTHHPLLLLKLEEEEGVSCCSTWEGRKVRTHKRNPWWLSRLVEEEGVSCCSTWEGRKVRTHKRNPWWLSRLEREGRCKFFNAIFSGCTSSKGWKLRTQARNPWWLSNLVEVEGVNSSTPTLVAVQVRLGESTNSHWPFFMFVQHRGDGRYLLSHSLGGC